MTDGGWGWSIVIGMVSIFISTTSQYGSFGLLFGKVLGVLGHETAAATLIINILAASVNFTGLLGGVLLGNWSYRKVAFLGAGIFFLGQILTVIATSLTQFVLAYGVISGIGLGLLAPSSYLALNTWWMEYRAMAMGIAQAAIGLGFIVAPPLIQKLLSEYGFRGTMLILSAISLHAMSGALMLIPKKVREKPKLLVQKQKRASRPASLCIADSGGVRVPDNHQAWDHEEPLHKEENSSWRSLVCDPILAHLFVVLAISFLADANFFTILPWHLSSRGLNQQQVAMCLSVAAGLDVIGRLIWPFVTGKFSISSRNSYLIACAASAILRSVLAEINGIASFITISAFVGFMKAGLVVNQALVIASRCSLQQFANAYSLYMAVSGFITIAFGPLIGMIRDWTGSFPTCIHLLSMVLFGCALSWCLEDVIIWRLRRRRGPFHLPYQQAPS